VKGIYLQQRVDVKSLELEKEHAIVDFVTNFISFTADWFSWVFFTFQVPQGKKALRTNHI